MDMELLGQRLRERRTQAGLNAWCELTIIGRMEGASRL